MNSLLSLRKTTLVILTLTWLGLAQPVSAQVLRPFKGYANVVITSANGPTLTASATGEATHLGAFTRTETLTFDPAIPGAFTGKLVFIADNGDKLCASFTGSFTPLGTALGTYTFTGGSGRFLYATGGAAFTAVPAGPGRFTITFQGTIQY
jgi:hypothetical protein